MLPWGSNRLGLLREGGHLRSRASNGIPFPVDGPRRRLPQRRHSLSACLVSDYQKAVREYLRSQKRREREELRVARELGRARKDREKAEEKQLAQWEVEEFQNRLNVLLSLHREAAETWDWNRIIASFPPCPPVAATRRERRVGQDLALAPAAGQKEAETLLEEAKQGDRLENEAVLKLFEEEKAEWERMTALARRILAGDLEAYKAAVLEFSPLAEMEQLGSTLEFTMHSASLVECRVAMKGTAAIPAEIKSLTSTGKLSVKAMPRQQFHEIYQDYICGGVLRIARELMALLPIDDLLVTVEAPTGETAADGPTQPVLSVVVERTALERMNFDRLDPSDTIETLVYRGDFKATRKTGAFQPIIPIPWEAVALPAHDGHGIAELLQRTVNLRNEIKENLGKLQEASTS